MESAIIILLVISLAGFLVLLWLRRAGIALVRMDSGAGRVLTQVYTLSSRWSVWLAGIGLLLALLLLLEILAPAAQGVPNPPSQVTKTSPISKTPVKPNTGPNSGSPDGAYPIPVLTGGSPSGVQIGLLMLLLAGVGWVAVRLKVISFPGQDVSTSSGSNLLRFPVRIYEGDSNLLILRLVHQTGQPLSLVDELGNQQSLDIPIEPGFKPQFLEVELLAAGFQVEGEKRQRRELQAGPMIFQWNLGAATSGNYEIGLVYRAGEGAGLERELGVTSHKVSVVKVAGLTGRQLALLSGIFGAVTAFLSLLEILKKLGILNYS